MVRIDVVVAVRNEEAALPRFIGELRALELPGEVRLGVLFIEDASVDGTLPVLRQLSKADPSIRYWALENGFGQGPALVFGLTHSTADAVIMMDVDGGHPTSIIPDMIEHFLRGARVVQARRLSDHGRPRYRTVGSAAFRMGARLLTGVDFAQQNIYFRLLAADLVPAIVDHPQYWPLLRFPLPGEGGGDLVVLDVVARDREFGATKYGPVRLARLAADGVLSLVEGTRAMALLFLAAAMALALLVAGSWILGFGLLLATAALVLRARALRQSDALSRMKVDETSDSIAE